MPGMIKRGGNKQTMESIEEEDENIDKYNQYGAVQPPSLNKRNPPQH